MKKFFRNTCVDTARVVGHMFLGGFYLWMVWWLIMNGSYWCQFIAAVVTLSYMIAALIGFVILMVDVIRRILAKKNESAPTEVSAD